MRKRSFLLRSGTTIGIVATTPILAAEIRPPQRSKQQHAHTPWSLPPLAQASTIKATPRGTDFLQECQDLVGFLTQLRGGGDDGRDDYYYDDDNYNDGYYDDRGRPSAPRKSSSSSSSILPDVIRKGNKRIGTMLLGSGIAVTVMGVMLFFNKSLMRLGNLLCVLGVPVFLGPSSVLSYFFKPERLRASACLGFGIFLVFVGWPIFGIALEVFGFLNLFKNMFPMLGMFLKNMPGIGNLVPSASSRKSRRREEDDYYYDDDNYDEYGRSNGRRQDGNYNNNNDYNNDNSYGSNNEGYDSGRGFGGDGGYRY